MTLGGASTWRAWRDGVGALTFPGDCQVCGLDPLGPVEAPSGLCDDCRGELLGTAGPACPRCALPVGPYAAACGECRGRRLGFDGALAIGPYQGPIRHLCLRLKRVEGAWLAPSVAGLLVEARGEELRDLAADLVVPVPLHWARRWHRGYDQAEALAGSLAERLGLPMARPLRRVRRTAPLWPHGRVERERLMRRAFRADRPGGGRLGGAVVLLVDDILTTGATCGAAARALKAAGARTVVAAVIARAEGKG